MRSWLHDTGRNCIHDVGTSLVMSNRLVSIIVINIDKILAPKLCLLAKEKMHFNVYMHSVLTRNDTKEILELVVNLLMNWLFFLIISAHFYHPALLPSISLSFYFFPDLLAIEQNIQELPLIINHCISRGYIKSLHVLLHVLFDLIIPMPLTISGYRSDKGNE